LHSFGAFHGDIKPENILLFESKQKSRLVAKIGDFGSTGAESSNDAPRWPTEEWAPPEYFDRELVENVDQDIARTTRDVYSFGLVCGYLASNGLKVRVYHGSVDQYFWSLSIGERYRDEIGSLGPLFHLLKETTWKEPLKRMQSLSGVRQMLM
jgi:serine/threonine protein kinase